MDIADITEENNEETTVPSISEIEESEKKLLEPTEDDAAVIPEAVKATADDTQAPSDDE